MIQKSHTNLLPIQNPLFWFSVTLSFLVGSTINLLPVTFKVFQKLFQAGFEMQGQVNLFYFMGAILGNVLAGFLTTRIGAGLSVRVGLALGSLGCLMLAFSQNFFHGPNKRCFNGNGKCLANDYFWHLDGRAFSRDPPVNLRSFVGNNGDWGHFSSSCLRGLH